ncbi:unnamed protein product [Euphydryas editha]|uniref:Uncharacterized protein n=1 Tax=Euphydryas editha TaxID=104508 RepID=A0AAU9UG45_EUPED|nr:unnamed protein product [Euphydryas editha]
MLMNNIMEINIQTNECREIELLAKSAAKIAFHNFIWHYVTLVLLNSTLSCGINAFLQEYNKTTVIANKNLIMKNYVYIKQYVLFGQKLTDIIFILEWMESYNFNTIGRFLIICESKDYKDCDETEAVKILWDHKIVNVIFINNTPNEGAVGYTYEYGHDCKNTPPLKVKNWDYCVKNKREYCEKKFPLKLKKLHGCPIIVSTFSQVPYMNMDDNVPSGADGDLLRIIIEALNATLVMRTPFRGCGWGNLNENGTWVGSLSDLYYDLANFSMTSASITQTRYSDFQMSNFYFEINLGWVTHPPELESPCYKLLRPFKPDTQIAMAISFITLIFVVLFFKTQICLYVQRKMNFGLSPEKVLFSSWEMCMGQPISSFPSKMALSYLVLIWIWYCFLMRTFYQVHLINSLKNDVYLTQLTSIEDAINAKYPFGGGSALKDYYIDQPLIYDNWQHKDSDLYFSIMCNLTEGMKFVLAMNLATTKNFLRVCNKKLHILPQRIINCPSVIFFKKFSPFVEPVNEVLERLVEFGWADMVFRNNTMAKSYSISNNEDKPIKLSNFAGCYMILLGGWILSFFILLLEIYYMKKQLKNIVYRN